MPVRSIIWQRDGDARQLSDDVLLLDRPVSAPESTATRKLAARIDEAEFQYTIVRAIHYMPRVVCLSGATGLMRLAKLTEHKSTDTLFTNPGEKKPAGYIKGRYR